MTGFDKHDEEVVDPPFIPIRAGGVIKMSDLRDLAEATDDRDEDDVLFVLHDRLQARS